MKKVRRFGLFAGTLLTSAWNQFRITGRVQWRVAPKIAAALWPGEPVPKGPGTLWWRRMRGCQRCSLYDRRRRACGHLGMTYQRGGVLLPLGCGCAVFLKAAQRDGVQCWLFEETGGEAGIDWRP